MTKLKKGKRLKKGIKLRAETKIKAHPKPRMMRIRSGKSMIGKKRKKSPKC